MINLVFGILLLYCSSIFLKDAWHVYRGRVTDKQGRTLWVYSKMSVRHAVAKDRQQALLLTIGVGTLSLLFGIGLVANFLLRHVR